MATINQKRAARQKSKNDQETWSPISQQKLSPAHSHGRKKAKPGSRGEDSFYRIIVRNKGQFTSFKHHHDGGPGGIERIAGRRHSGSWATQAWLIPINRAIKTNGSLNALDDQVQQVFEQLGSQVAHVKGGIFKAKPRENVPDKEKLLLSQLNTWQKISIQ